MYCIFLIGPAGVGKTSLLKALQIHYTVMNTVVSIVNFDPVARFNTEHSDTLLDINDFVSAEKLIEDKRIGPNLALIKALNLFLKKHVNELLETLSELPENEIVLFDVPGQIELLWSNPTLSNLIASVLSGTQVTDNRDLGTIHSSHSSALLYLLDASFFMGPPNRVLSGFLALLATAHCFTVPLIHVLAKYDLLGTPSEATELAEKLVDKAAEEGDAALVELLKDYWLASWIPVSVKEENSIAILAAKIDSVIGRLDEKEWRETDLRNTEAFLNK